MLCYVTLEHQAWQIFRRLIYFNTLTECYTPFFFLRMLFFRPRLNILIFPPILGLKYSCIILKLQLMTFPFQNLLGYQLQVFGIQICIALHCARAPSLFVAVSEVKMSRQTTLGRFGFRTQNDIYPFQNLSLGFILKISQISASIFLYNL